MVHRCILCRTSYSKTSSGTISFHRLPADPDRKAEWLKRLGYEKNTVLPKYVVFCSNHFEEKDFIIRPSGLRVLRKTAVPIEYVPKTWGSLGSSSTSESFSSESTSGESTEDTEETFIIVTEETSSNRTEVTQDQPPSPEWDYVVDVDGEAGPSSETVNVGYASDTSATLTASEDGDTPSSHDLHSELIIEDDIKPIGIVNLFPAPSDSEQHLIPSVDHHSTISDHEKTCCHCRNLKKIESQGATEAACGSVLRQRRGRITAETLTKADFMIPAKVEQNYNIMKHRLQHQNKKIRTLQQTVRRLKSRVYSLTMSVTELRKKCSILEKTR